MSPNTHRFLYPEMAQGVNGQDISVRGLIYIVSERKLGFFVQIKSKIPHSERGKTKILTAPLKYSGTGIHTLSISRIKIWVWRRYGRKRQFSFRHYLANGRLHNLNLLIRQLIQFIDQLVYLAVGGFDLSLNDSIGLGRFGLGHFLVQREHMFYQIYDLVI